MFYIYYTSSVFEFFFRTPRNRTGTIILGSLLRNQYTFHPFAKQFWDKTDLLFSRLSKAGKRFHLQCRRPQFDSCIWKIPWRRDRLPSPIFLGFSGGSDGKESTCNVGDLGLIPGSGRPSGGGHGNSLRYSCLENPHGQRSLAGYSPWGCKESDTTKQLCTILGQAQP